MKKLFVWVILGCKECKLFVVPPLPDPLAHPAKTCEAPVGNRGNYSPGRNNWHGFGRGQMP